MAIQNKTVQCSVKNLINIILYGTEDTFANAWNGDFKFNPDINIEVDEERYDTPTIELIPTKKLVLNRVAYEEHIEYYTAGKRFTAFKTLDTSQYEEFAWALQGANLPDLTQIQLFNHATIGYSGREWGNNLIAPTLYGRRIDGTVSVIVNGAWNLYTMNSEPVESQIGSLTPSVYNMNCSNSYRGQGDPINSAIAPMIRASAKVFYTKSGAINYLTTGEEIDEIGASEEEPAEDRITTLFYASNIYSRAYNESNLQRLGASTIYIDIQYAKNDGTIIVDKNRAICGYVNTNNEINDENHFGNIIWMAANNVKILETKQSWLNGGFSDTKTLPQFATTTGFYGPLIDGNTIYESRYNTNMRIFANRADAEEFLRGGNPTPIAGGTNAGQFNPDKLVGDPTVYNNPSADISADMSSCWILTKSEVDELANILATGLTSQESEENGLLVNTLLTTGRSFSAHAEPIDAIVDLFWLPFNPREFSNNDYDHLVFAEDKYCSFEALGEAVDAAGQAVKGAYSNPVGNAFLPGGVFVNAYESGKAVGEKIASVIDVGETLNKFNIVSNMRDGMN